MPDQVEPLLNQNDETSARPTAGQIVRRYLVLIGLTLGGLAATGGGFILLITGLSNGDWVDSGLGIVLIAGVIGLTLWRFTVSKRKFQQENAALKARLAEGIRQCPRCRFDFEDQLAQRTREPLWYPIGAGLFGLFLIVFAALALYLYGLFSREGYKAAFVGVGGVACIGWAVQSPSRRLIRCPQCAKVCGTEEANIHNL